MIRVSPKTSSGKAFDPIESAVHACAGALKKQGAKVLKVTTPNGVVTMPVTGYGSSGLTPNQRLDILLSERAEFDLEAVFVEGSSFYKLILINDLQCSPATVLNESSIGFNADYAGDEFAYPEAYEHGLGRNAISTEAEYVSSKQRGGRPWVSYVCESINSTEIICRGPDKDCWKNKKYFATVKVPVGKSTVPMRLFGDYDLVDDQVIVVDEDVTAEDLRGAKFYLRFVDSNGKVAKTRLHLTQAVPMLNNVPLSGESYLKALAIAAGYESRAGRDEETFTSVLPHDTEGIYIDCRQVNGRMLLNNNCDDFYYKYVIDDAYLNSVLGDFFGDKDSLYLNLDKKAVVISSNNKTVTCFALCMAAVTSQFIDGSLLTALASLKSLTAQHGLKIVEKDDGYTIIGNGNDTWSIEVPCTTGTAILSLKRSGFGGRDDASKARPYSYLKDVKSFWEARDALPDGSLFIFGYDKPGISDMNDGEPGHWIVLQKQGEKNIAVFDPYRKGAPVAAGTEMTAMMKSGTSETAAVILSVPDGVAVIKSDDGVRYG